MRNQRTALRVGAFVVMSLLAVGSVVAAGPGRLPQPRIMENGLHAIDPRPGFLPLGIGTPKSIAMVESWVTSDLVTDDYSTYPFWYDSENISIFLAFYTAKATPVNITVQVKDQTGATVFAGTDTETFDPETLVGGTIPITDDAGTPKTLAVGAYKVSVKVKQGTKSVGQQYWLLVYADPGL